MNETRHEIKKRMILDSAFSIWGARRYMNTSLSDLASAQNITKQALYHYFPSKEKMEQAMENNALETYNRHADTLFNHLSKLSGDHFITTYTDSNIDFVTQNKQLLGFLAYRYRQCSDGPKITRKHMKAFSDIAYKNAGVPEVGLRYLNSLTFMKIHEGERKNPAADNWEEIWNEGFGSGFADNRPDYDQLLSDASAVNYSVFEDDPLMRAVFDTVMEEAGTGISLGTVARKAGLSKSSIYNYWPGKDAMLRDVLSRQITMFSRLFEEFAAKYSRPENRFFAYLAFTGTFFRRTPEILNYLQRVMAYGIQIPQNKDTIEESLIRPMSSILESGLLNLHGYEPGELLSLVNLAAVNEIKYHLTESSARIRIEQGLKDLYLLIMGGISALRRTM